MISIPQDLNIPYTLSIIVNCILIPVLLAVVDDRAALVDKVSKLEIELRRERRKIKKWTM